MNNSTSIWKNEIFWYRLSILSITVWLIVAAMLGLMIHFSLPHQMEIYQGFLGKHTLGFFLYPALTLYTGLNAVPFVADWFLSNVDINSIQKKVHEVTEIKVSSKSYEFLTNKLNSNVKES
jgi:hypothetical protein